MKDKAEMTKEELIALGWIKNPLDKMQEKTEKLTAVEWLEQELDKNFEIRGNSFLFDKILKQAKEMEKEQIYSEDEVRKAIELARETELKTGGYDPRPFTSDKYSKQEIINQLKSE